MREILFRGKDQRTGKWHIGYYAVRIDRFCNMQTEIMQTDGSRVAVDWESVGQFSGLFDKNGVKIFEGDIISAHLDEDFPEDETRLEVVYKDYGFLGRNLNFSGFYDTIEPEFAKQFEVIGNIFDDPELLNGALTAGENKQ